MRGVVRIWPDWDATVGDNGRAYDVHCGEDEAEGRELEFRPLRVVELHRLVGSTFAGAFVGLFVRRFLAKIDCVELNGEARVVVVVEQGRAHDEELSLGPGRQETEALEEQREDLHDVKGRGVLKVLERFAVGHDAMSSWKSGQRPTTYFNADKKVSEKRSSTGQS